MFLVKKFCDATAAKPFWHGGVHRPANPLPKRHCVVVIPKTDASGLVDIVGQTFGFATP